jgi:hypothetical protein
VAIFLQVSSAFGWGGLCRFNFDRAFFAFWLTQSLQKAILTAVSFRVIHFLQLAWTAL